MVEAFCIESKVNNNFALKCPKYVSPPELIKLKATKTNQLWVIQENDLSKSKITSFNCTASVQKRLQFLKIKNQYRSSNLNVPLDEKQKDTTQYEQFQNLNKKS